MRPGSTTVSIAARTPSAPAATGLDPGAIRVVTWNIHKGIGPDRKYALERTAEVLRGIDADVLCLAACKKMEVRAGNDNGWPEHRILHAQQCFLIGRSVADQWQELLRQGVARHRPQPCPGATCEQNGNDR